MSIHQRFYCSDLSREDGEQMYGTGGVGDVWLLLEYSQPWARKAFADSELPDEVKSHLKSVMRAVPSSKILFIKQDSPTRNDITLFVAVCREKAPCAYRFSIKRYEQLLELDIPAVVAGRHQQNSRIDHPLFLICTDGKHDKCCTKYGYPVYKAARNDAGRAAWQSSHVGGDRFAANMVCFPHGIFYGHVARDAVGRIIDEYRRGRVYLNNYRGRACYPRAAQVAEFFVRSESGITDLDELFLIDVSVGAHGSAWRARFSSPKDERVHEVRFAGFESEFKNRLTCSASEEKNVMQYELTAYSVA